MGIEKPFDRLTRLILNERPFDPESRDQTSLLLALANSLPAKFLVPAVIAALDIGGRRNANTVLARLGRRIRGAQAEVNDAILKTEDEWKRRRVICSLAPYLNRESLQRCIQSINGPLYAREYAQIHQFLPPENRVELLSKRLDAFTRGAGIFWQVMSSCAWRSICQILF